LTEEVRGRRKVDKEGREEREVRGDVKGFLLCLNKI
jgi:hypothetical protein